MKKTLVLVLSLAAAALAQAAASSPTQFFSVMDVAAIAAMAFAAVGCAIAQGSAIGKAMEGMARQPEASGRIQGVLLIGLGFIESLAIYVLVIALILIFANPAASVITH